MKKHRGRDANMKFLFGSVFFFLVIVITISLFGYFSLQQYWNKSGVVVKNAYEISFSKQFNGLNYDLYLNDSLLYEGKPVSSDSVMCVERVAPENALLVVEKESDLVTVIEIGQRGRILICFGKDGDITADVIE